jgi:hypothetical protein
MMGAAAPAQDDYTASNLSNLSNIDVNEATYRPYEICVTVTDCQTITGQPAKRVSRPGNDYRTGARIGPTTTLS